MRKTISLLLIISLMMCMPCVFAEMNMDAAAMEELLQSDKWIDIYTYGTNSIDFSGGSVGGTFECLSPGSMKGYSNTFFHDKPYTIDDGVLTVTSVNTFTNVERVYFSASIIEYEGFILLQSDVEKNETGRVMLFCRAADYKKLKGQFEIPKLENSVTLKTADGEIIETCGREIIQNCMDNPLRFENTYQNAEVTVVSRIGEINGSTVYNGHEMKGYVKLEGGWVVDVSNSINTVMDMSKGDLVKVTGRIFYVPSSGFSWYDNEIQVYIVNGNETTIELYSE